jgi:hypothetical protein
MQRNKEFGLFTKPSILKTLERPYVPRTCRIRNILFSSTAITLAPGPCRTDRRNYGKMYQLPEMHGGMRFSETKRHAQMDGGKL